MQAAAMPPISEEEADGGPMKRQRLMPPPAPPPPAAGGGNGAWGKGSGGKDSFSSFGSKASGPPPLAMPPAIGAAPVLPAVTVFLAPATKNIVPISSKPGPNKQLAMQFIASTREVQTQMLRDPNVAKAILQTLSDSPQHHGGSLASLLGTLAPGSALAPMGLPGAPPPPNVPAPPPPVLAPPPPVPAVPQGGTWSGMITLARNKGKRLSMRSVLLHGKVSDVEVALRCAGTTFGALDITHRVPYEEVAKRAATGSLLSMMPSTAAEHIQYEEYAKYFRGKGRAGVAKLDGDLSLYVLAPCDDVLELRNSVYALNPGMTPRSNCLLGLISSSNEQMLGNNMPVARVPPAAVIAPAVPAVPETAPAAEPEAAAAEEQVKKEAAEEPEAPAKAEEAGDREGGAGDAGDDAASQKEILDLFSNPELIKLLSDDLAPSE